MMAETPRKRRLLIVDVVDNTPTYTQEEPPKRVLTKGELHAKAQSELLEAAQRYKYPIGLSEEFEKPIWKRVDKILRALTQEEAEKLAFDAVDLGTLSICVWHKKVKT
jgi:hypothetical protein